MDTKAKAKLDALTRHERFRVARDWCFGIGAAVTAASGLSVNTNLIADPKAWAPTGGVQFFIAPFLSSGWFATASLCIGAALLLIAGVLTLIVRNSP